MSTVLDDPAVRAYLDELRAGLADSPERELVLEGVMRHIEDSVGDRQADPATVQRVLDELGDPAVIVAEVAPGTGVPADRVGLLERRSGMVLTALVIAFGGLVVPVLGWFVGLFLLWRSRCWTVADKVIVTAAPLALTLVLLGVSVPLSAAGLSLSHLAVLLGLLLGTVGAGAYLLVRGRPQA